MLSRTILRGFSTAVGMAEKNVVHDAKGQRFVMKFENGDEAYVEYKKSNDGVYDFFHTFTPESQRGKGVAAIVSKAAMDYIQSNGHKVKLTCSYLDTKYSSDKLYKDNVVSKY